MQAQIVQVGNSLGLRLPKSLLDEFGLGKASLIDLRVADGSIVIKPLCSPRAGWAQAYAADPVSDENLWGDIPADEVWGDERG